MGIKHKCMLWKEHSQVEQCFMKNVQFVLLFHNNYMNMRGYSLFITLTS